MDRDKVRETENTQQERDEEVYLCFPIYVVCVKTSSFTAASVICGLKWERLPNLNVIENE